MVRSFYIAASILASSTGVFAALQTCGQAQYDPEQYVCWHNQFLCPVKAGEPLSFCAGACYSKFMYTCSPQTNTLSLLPALPNNTPFRLSVSNPSILILHGQPITAGGLHWNIGGTTSSYCPAAQVGAACPRGEQTSFRSYEGRVSMNVIVPGGQQAYLGPDSYMAYTQAHSAYIPPGSKQAGFGVYQGGGFVNLNSGGWGWVACPPRASGGGGGVWGLVARNESTADSLSAAGCKEINLKVEKGDGDTYGAWQYT